jgi:hypothetical protein
VRKDGLRRRDGSSEPRHVLFPQCCADTTSIVVPVKTKSARSACDLLDLRNGKRFLLLAVELDGAFENDAFDFTVLSSVSGPSK